VEARWREIADGVLVRRYAELDLTVGLVLGDGACLVVDTRGDLVQGAELAGAVHGVTADPWTVVLTHAHFDHAFGTAAFLPAPVWAHEGARADLVATGHEQRDAWARHYREAGRPEIAEALAAVEPALPDHLVTDRAALDIGGREVALVHPGPGHTDHDLVVHVPDAGVVFAGDLVEHGAPPAFEDAFPAAWPAALDRVLALGATTVVPGHGEPVDAAFVAGQRADIAAVARLAAEVASDRRRWADALLRSPYPEGVLRAAVDRIRTTPTRADR
jgi:glyoxylase-like metal-dependent hydrolase (beta-lactamase superfamily II)